MSELQCPTLYLFLFVYGGQTKVANCLCCQNVKQFSSYEPCFSKTTKLSAMDFTCYFKVFAQYCVKIPYTSGESHCIKFHGLIDKFLFTMSSWKKNISCGGPFWPYSQGGGEGGHLHALNFKTCRIHLTEIHLDQLL